MHSVDRFDIMRDIKLVLRIRDTASLPAMIIDSTRSVSMPNPSAYQILFLSITPLSCQP